MNKMEKQTEKLEMNLKVDGPKHEIKRQHEWFQTNKEKKEEKERLALTRHQGKGKDLILHEHDKHNRKMRLSNIMRNDPIEGWLAGYVLCGRAFLGILGIL